MFFTLIGNYALNVMQELSAIVPAREKQNIVKTAISKVIIHVNKHNVMV